MPKRSRRNKNRRVIPILLASMICLGALGYYAATGAAKLSGGPTAQAPSVFQGVEDSGRTERPGRTAKVVSAHDDGTQTTYQATSTSVPDGQDARIFAVNSYLLQLPMVPKGAKIIGIDIHDGVANLSVSREFRTTYSTDDEKVIMDGVSNTLGGFPEIKSFTFECEGKQLDTLGSFDLTEPTPVKRALTGTPSGTSATPVSASQTVGPR